MTLSKGLVRLLNPSTPVTCDNLLPELCPRVEDSALKLEPAAIGAMAQGNLKVMLPLKVPTDQKNPITLTIRKDPCDFGLEAITPVYVGLSGGHLYFRILEKGTCSAAEIPSDDVKLKTNNIELGRLEDVSEEPTVRKARILKVSNDSNVTFEAEYLGSTVAAGSIVARPMPLLGSPLVLIGLPKLNDSGESDLIPSSDGKLAANRSNFIEFNTPELDRWTLEVVSPHMEPCRKSGVPERPKLLSLEENGTVCVRPRRASDQPLVLEATYSLKSTEVQKVMAGFVKSGPNDFFERESKRGRLDMGTTTVNTGLAATPFSLALNLRERAKVVCQEPRRGTTELALETVSAKIAPDAVVATATSGPKAVPNENLDTCHVRIDLRGTPWTLADKYRATLAEDYGAELLARIGRQTFSVVAELPSTEENKPATVLASEIVVVPSTETRHVIKDEALLVPIRIKHPDATELKEYGLIRVTVSHHDKTAYAKDLERSFPEEKLEVALRRMPAHLAGRWRNGIGHRMYFTLEVPTGLYRTPGSGFGTVTSSTYEKVESVAYGVGSLFVVEAWNFDANKQWLPLNPQFHAGVFASQFLTPQPAIPRVSFVVGGALRLPIIGSKPGEAIESGLRTVIWMEWSQRARGNWSQALLFGFSANLGSFPN